MKVRSHIPFTPKELRKAEKNSLLCVWTLQHQWDPKDSAGAGPTFHPQGFKDLCLWSTVRVMRCRTRGFRAVSDTDSSTQPGQEVPGESHSTRWVCQVSPAWHKSHRWNQITGHPAQVFQVPERTSNVVEILFSMPCPPPPDEASLVPFISVMSKLCPMYLVYIHSFIPLAVLAAVTCPPHPYPDLFSDLSCHLPGRKLRFPDSLAPAAAGF